MPYLLTKNSFANKFSFPRIFRFALGTGIGCVLASRFEIRRHVEDDLVPFLQKAMKHLDL